MKKIKFKQGRYLFSYIYILKEGSSRKNHAKCIIYSRNWAYGSDKSGYMKKSIFGV